MDSMAVHVQAMLDFHRQGIPTIDYGNNIRQMALEKGVEDAFDFPGFVPACIRPLFCRGYGPFRWAALSGDPEDIYRTDEKVKELIPEDPHLHLHDVLLLHRQLRSVVRDLLNGDLHIGGQSVQGGQGGGQDGGDSGHSSGLATPPAQSTNGGGGRSSGGRR